jgi:translation initiation factor 2 gamma subunit (eIF-2gamma)
MSTSTSVTEKTVELIRARDNVPHPTSRRHFLALQSRGEIGIEWNDFLIGQNPVKEFIESSNEENLIEQKIVVDD